MAYAFHPRADWLKYSRHGMSGPSQDRTKVTQIVIHYNGGNADLDGPDNIYQDEDYARVLANMNNQYWESATRGYALGYNYGCGPDGDLWEIRGLDIRCGANGCQLVNVPAVAIQVTTRAITAPPTDAQIDALKNRWVPWLRQQYPRNLTIVGHRDVRSKCSDGGSTVCPGPQLYPLVQQGYFNSPDQGGAEEEPVTEEEMRKVARYVTEEIISGAAGGLGPATLEQTLFEIRTLVRGIAPIAQDVDTVEPSLVVVNRKLDEIAAALAGAGSPDLEVIKNAVRVQLDNTKLGPLEG